MSVVILIVVLLGVAIVLLVQGLGSFAGSDFFSGTNLNEVAVGQCFNGGRAEGSDTSTVINTVEVVDCAMPHEGELMASFQYSGDTSSGYPEETLVSYAETECSVRFAQYVGVAFDNSTLEMTFVYPQSAGWLFGDRSIQCVANPPLGQSTMTGSVRGTGR